MTTFHKFLANDLNRIAERAVGFDRMFDVFENMVTEKSTYPHHNIIKTGQETYLVELAVAGFAESDISIELEKNVLHIRGEKEETEFTQEFEYLHRGIATRSFHKTIQLADTIEVGDASLEHGILRVFLQNIIPEEKKPKKIPIKSMGKKQLLTE
jgi:molecular chaperone IbpA